MIELENMIDKPTVENIISFLNAIKLEYNNAPENEKQKYIEELKNFMLFIIFNVEQNQKEKLGKKSNSFMIRIQDYWLIICWYLIISCKEPFLDNIDKIIDVCKKEWINDNCYNLNDNIISDLINLSEEKFNLISILENSESSFFYFNIPFKNRDTECNIYTISELVYIFELYGVENEKFPLQISFCYFLGLSLYFYILEKKPNLIDEYRKEFNDTDEDCSEQFGERFALALLQFTDYDIEEIDIRIKERYTRYFEKLTSNLCLTRRIAKNQICPCGSGKKYKDCCKGKELEWITINGKVNKQICMNDIVSYSVKDLLSEFSKMFGRNPYKYESMYKILNVSNGFYEDFFSKIADEHLPLDIQYAILKTGMFLSEHNFNQFSDFDIKEWNDSIEEFENKNSFKIYNNKSVFELVREANKKLKKLNQRIQSVDYVMNEYLNTFPINYGFSNLVIKNQQDFSVVCVRKIVIDTNILLSAFNHKSVEEATNITRIIFEDLIQTEILLKDKKLFEEKIIPLTLLEKGKLEYKKSTEGNLSKNILVDPKTGKEYNIKINIKDLSLKSSNYKKIYDNVFDALSSFIHLNVKKIPNYFNVPNPLTDVQQYKIICLLGLFLINQCIFEVKSNVKLDKLQFRDMEYIYSKNVIYINKCLKILLILDANNEVYEHILKVQKVCFKTINPNNKIRLSS